jgi:hypothetical protein
LRGKKKRDETSCTQLTKQDYCRKRSKTVKLAGEAEELQAPEQAVAVMAEDEEEEEANEVEL